MPYMQQPNTAGTIHGTQQYGQTSRSSSFAEVSSSSISAGAPPEAFGNISPRQDPCMYVLYQTPKLMKVLLILLVLDIHQISLIPLPEQE
jgi:hypothetical protein